MNIQIFVVTHGPIYPEFYNCDDSFDPSIFTFCKVGPQSWFDHDLVPSGCNKLLIDELCNFKSLGPSWAETEAIYNIYVSQLYQEYDYVGFIHYDHTLFNGFCHQLKSIYHAHKSLFMAFNTHQFLNDYRQMIILDETRPNLLQDPSGPNCYKTILSHYNLVYNKNIKLWNLADKKISLSSSYLCSKTIFEDLMNLLSWVIESKVLLKYDTLFRHRLQGGMAERYVAIYSSQIPILEFPLKHEYRYYKKYLSAEK